MGQLQKELEPPPPMPASGIVQTQIYKWPGQSSIMIADQFTAQVEITVESECSSTLPRPAVATDMTRVETQRYDLA